MKRNFSTKRKSDVYNLTYLVHYIKKDMRGMCGEIKVDEPFYFKKDMVRHLRRAYCKDKVLSEVEIYKIKCNLPKVNNKLDRIVVLNKLDKIDKEK